jgi:hypothetical protein
MTRAVCGMCVRAAANLHPKWPSKMLDDENWENTLRARHVRLCRSLGVVHRLAEFPGPF